MVIYNQLWITPGHLTSNNKKTTIKDAECDIYKNKSTKQHSVISSSVSEKVNTKLLIFYNRWTFITIKAG